MPENFNLDEALDDENTPQALREWAKRQAADNQRLAKELAEFRNAQRKSTIAEALKAKGLNEKIAAFYPGDAEASAEAVAKWVGDYADVFAPKPAETPAAQSDTIVGMPDHNPLAADVQAAMQMVQNATPTVGGNTPNLMDRVAELDRLDMRRDKDAGQKLDEFQKEVMGMAGQYYRQMHT